MSTFKVGDKVKPRRAGRPILVRGEDGKMMEKYRMDEHTRGLVLAIGRDDTVQVLVLDTFDEVRSLAERWEPVPLDER